MPPKKKKGKGDAPEPLKVKMAIHAIGPGKPDPVEFTLPPSTSLTKARHTIDQVATSQLQTTRGSVLFGSWTMMQCYPSYKKSNREMRQLNPRLVYDATWLSRIGIAEESFVSLKPRGEGRAMQVTWYINVPDVPSFREAKTAAELAKEEFEKFKAEKLGGSKKKKKK